MDIKLCFKFKIELIQIDLKQIFPMKPSEFEISLSVKSYDKKNCDKNCRNGYVEEKCIFSTLQNIEQFQILIAQI